MYNFKINDQNKEDSSTSRTSSNKPPTGIPRTDRDFKKILDDKDKDKNSERDPRNTKSTAPVDGLMAYEEIANAEEKLKQQQPSLFDLSKGNVKKNVSDETFEVAQMASSDELAMETPSSLFKNLALKEKGEKTKKASENYVEGAFGKKEESTFDEERKTPTLFPRESIDLSYVNPLALNTPAIAAIEEQKLSSMNSQKMSVQEIIAALVKEITTIEAQGKTDTVVILNHPPIFKDAHIVLTSYESAKGEFNIRFENLKPDAKAFMDMQQNQESLLSNLQQKGYAVHIVVVTTQTETPQIVTADARQSSRDAQDQEQQQKGRQNQKEKEEK